jgi:hypothetical protein
MKRYKVIFKYKYGRSFKYTDIVRTENAQRLEIIKEIPIKRLRELEQAEKERRLVVLSEPMKPMVYKPNDTDLYCPSCGEILSGGWPLSDADDLRKLCQCPNCGQSIDDTRCEAAEAALEERNAEHDVPMIDIEELIDIDQLKTHCIYSSDFEGLTETTQTEIYRYCKMNAFYPACRANLKQIRIAVTRIYFRNLGLNY